MVERNYYVLTLATCAAHHLIKRLRSGKTKGRGRQCILPKLNLGEEEERYFLKC